MAPSNQSVLRAASDAIQRWPNTDDLVTKALRRTGFGGDYFGITYPNDLDELEATNSPLSEGFVRVEGVDEKWDVEERWYLELLIKACQTKGMDERAELLERFRNDPQIADDLLEADVKRCNERWKSCIPFLVKHGWTIEDDGMVAAPNYGWGLNAEHFCDDLDVLLRSAQRLIKRAEKSDPSNQQYMKYINAQRSMIQALNEFFESE